MAVRDAHAERKKRRRAAEIGISALGAVNIPEYVYLRMVDPMRDGIDCSLHVARLPWWRV